MEDKDQKAGREFTDHSDRIDASNGVASSGAEIDAFPNRIFTGNFQEKQRARNNEFPFSGLKRYMDALSLKLGGDYMVDRVVFNKRNGVFQISVSAEMEKTLYQSKVDRAVQETTKDHSAHVSTGLLPHSNAAGATSVRSR